MGPPVQRSGTRNAGKATVMRPEDAFAGQASQEHETSHLRLTVKDSRRVEAGARRRISDSRGQDDSAGSRSRNGRLERTGSRRAGGRRTCASRRDSSKCDSHGSPHSWRTRLREVATDWCSCRRMKLHLGRVELWFASSGGSCGRTMAEEDGTRAAPSSPSQGGVVCAHWTDGRINPLCADASGAAW